MADSSISLIEKGYPMVTAGSYEHTISRLMSDEPYRKAMRGWVSSLREFVGLDFDLSRFPPETDLELAYAIAGARHSVISFLKTVDAISTDRGGRGEEEWAEMRSVYERDYYQAQTALSAAWSLCARAMRRVPIEYFPVEPKARAGAIKGVRGVGD